MYYSFNTILPNDAKLTWHLVDGSDGNKYYTTGTIVVQNNGDEDSVLSLTNMKWTFSQNGGKGYFRIPTPIENEVLTLATTTETQAAAYSLVRMRTADLGIEQLQEPVVITDDDGNKFVVLSVKTSTEVDSFVVTDSIGNNITPENLTYTVTNVDGHNVIEWQISIPADENGAFDYIISGAYENGYTDSSKAVNVSGASDNSDDTQFNVMSEMLNKLLEIIKSIIASLGFYINVI
jgi:hypothetical protein